MAQRSARSSDTRVVALAHRPQRGARAHTTTRAIAQPYQHVGLRCQGKRSGCSRSGERRIDRGGDGKRSSCSREQRGCHGGRSREQHGERSSGGRRHGGGRRAAARLRRVVARVGRRVDAALAHKIGRRRGPSRPQRARLRLGVGVLDRRRVGAGHADDAGRSDDAGRRRRPADDARGVARGAAQGGGGGASRVAAARGRDEAGDVASLRREPEARAAAGKVEGEARAREGGEGGGRGGGRGRGGGWARGRAG